MYIGVTWIIYWFEWRTQCEDLLCCFHTVWDLKFPQRALIVSSHATAECTSQESLKKIFQFIHLFVTISFEPCCLTQMRFRSSSVSSRKPFMRSSSSSRRAGRIRMSSHVICRKTSKDTSCKLHKTFISLEASWIKFLLYFEEEIARFFLTEKHYESFWEKVFNKFSELLLRKTNVNFLKDRES